MGSMGSSARLWLTAFALSAPLAAPLAGLSAPPPGLDSAPPRSRAAANCAAPVGSALGAWGALGAGRARRALWARPRAAAASSGARCVTCAQQPASARRAADASGPT